MLLRLRCITLVLRTVAAVVACAFLSPPSAPAQEIQWVRQFGTDRQDVGRAVAKGPSGVYVTGNTAGVFAGENSSGPGFIDVFLSRYDEQGNTRWTRQFGSAADDDGTGVAADQTGVYVVGWTDGALPGQTSLGSTDAFIRKYDVNGTLLWTRQFGSANQDQALGVSTDGTAVYVVGRTEGNIITGAGGTPDSEAFIRRYDPNGVEVWTRQFGTVDVESAEGVATDGTGIYVVGYTNGALAGPQQGRDGFLRKYDSSGNELWTRQFGTSSTDTAYAVAVGALGVYVGGETVETFPGETRQGGLYDAFLMKFDVSGTQRWVRQFGTIYDDWVNALAVTAGSVVVGMSAGETMVDGPFTGSAAVLFFDFDGGRQATVQFGNGSNDVVNAAAADVTGVYVAGVKQGDALNQVPLGDLDAFAMKLKAPPPTSFPFSISNLSGLSTTSDGTGGLSVGHARIDTSSGTTPSGVAIFGYRPSGVLVTEAGVPDSPLITSGRIYAEVSATGLVNTGLAIANPNNQTATFTFTLANTAGTVIKSDSRTIGPNGQVAGFLTEAPYSAATGYQGTLSFTSSVPVGVIALRSLLNERNDFLITTLPVIDLSQGASSGTQVIPHFAVGDGWGTQIILVNPTDTVQTGNVQFLGPGSAGTPAAAVTVNIDGTAASSAPYSVAPRSSLKLVAAAAAPGLAAGSVRVVPTNNGAVPTPLVIFGYKPGPFTLSEAGVPVTTGTSFRMYVEASASPVILTGFAVANTANTAATVTFELSTLQGTPVATSPARPIPASGQLVGFLSDFFPNLQQPFQGVLRVATSSPGVSVVALRQRLNERGDYLITTTPPTLETGTATAAARSFPHFANGDGYTTQFILYSGTTGQSGAGNVKFFRQDGTPMPVTLR